MSAPEMCADCGERPVRVELYDLTRLIRARYINEEEPA